MEKNKIYDVIILGAGPAGLSAGIYASRAKLDTLILNEGTIGGQVTLTNEIANYPGVETTHGYSLVGVMKKQAKSFGCKIKSNINVSKLDIRGKIKTITVNNSEEFKAKSIILSPGGKPRMLNIPGEKEFKGTGVSYCATCDGDFFTDKHVVVVGGGNSALEEAVSLTKHARKVTIVHQFDHFQAFDNAIEEVMSNSKIELVFESELREIKGDSKVNSVHVEHIPSGKIESIDADGVFIFIGYIPSTEIINGDVDTTEYGEIIASPEMETSLSGVFAAGDSIQKKYRQVATAVSDGAIAALAVADYIRSSRN